MTVATWGIPGFFCCIYRRKIHAIFFIWQAAAARQVIFFRIDIAYIGSIFVVLYMSPIDFFPSQLKVICVPSSTAMIVPCSSVRKTSAPRSSKTTERFLVGMTVHIAFAAGNHHVLRIGLPQEIFTPLFAMARIVGWCAHRNEELNFEGKRIIRPAYKNVLDEVAYVPIKKR